MSGKLRFSRMPETLREVRIFLKDLLGEKDPKTMIPLSELRIHLWFTEGRTGEAKAAAGSNPTLVTVI